MGKRERRIFTEEFKQEAVRLTETSGRTIAGCGRFGTWSFDADTLETAILGSRSAGRAA
jgi:hypothetical protein